MIDIQSLCEEANIDISTLLLLLLEKVHHKIKNRSIKTELMKLSNPVFQIMPTE